MGKFVEHLVHEAKQHLTMKRFWCSVGLVSNLFAIWLGLGKPTLDNGSLWCSVGFVSNLLAIWVEIGKPTLDNGSLLVLSWLRVQFISDLG